MTMLLPWADDRAAARGGCSTLKWLHCPPLIWPHLILWWRAVRSELDGPGRVAAGRVNVQDGVAHCPGELVDEAAEGVDHGGGGGGGAGPAEGGPSRGGGFGGVGRGGE